MRDLQERFDLAALEEALKVAPEASDRCLPPTGAGPIEAARAVARSQQTLAADEQPARDLILDHDTVCTEDGVEGPENPRSEEIRFHVRAGGGQSNQRVGERAPVVKRLQAVDGLERQRDALSRTLAKNADVSEKVEGDAVVPRARFVQQGKQGPRLQEQPVCAIEVPLPDTGVGEADEVHALAPSDPPLPEQSQAALEARRGARDVRYGDAAVAPHEQAQRQCVDIAGRFGEADGAVEESRQLLGQIPDRKSTRL